MLIGAPAERTRTSTVTLRSGPVQAHRDSNGDRRYEDAELRIVRGIQALLAVGFGLDDIKPFVHGLRAGNACPGSVAVLRPKSSEVDAFVDAVSPAPYVDAVSPAPYVDAVSPAPYAQC